MATVNTSWVSPASATLDKATGATIDEGMTDGWSSDLYHLGGLVGYIGCRAYASAALSVATATFTALGLNTESFDSDPNGAMHDTVTNNNRVTARTAGVYHVACYVEFASNSTGYRQTLLRANGTVVVAADSRPAVNGADTTVALSQPYLLAAGDYVEVLVAHTAGVSINVLTQVLSCIKA